jgi:PRTRC genetic system protein E
MKSTTQLLAELARVAAVKVTLLKIEGTESLQLVLEPQSELAGKYPAFAQPLIISGQTPEALDAELAKALAEFVPQYTGAASNVQASLDELAKATKEAAEAAKAKVASSKSAKTNPKPTASTDTPSPAPKQEMIKPSESPKPAPADDLFGGMPDMQLPALSIPGV